MLQIKFADNTAGSDGGAIYLSADVTGSIDSAACFTGNQAGQKGGAIYMQQQGSAASFDLYSSLQSFGNNKAMAADGSNTLFLEAGSTLTCLRDDGGPQTTLDAGAYNIEGHICTEYTQYPTAQSTVADPCTSDSKTCTCPAMSVFNADACACGLVS